MNVTLPSGIYFNYLGHKENRFQLLIYKPLSKIEIVVKVALATIKNPITLAGIAIGAICSIIIIPAVAAVIPLVVSIAVAVKIATKKVKTAENVTGQIIGRSGNCIPLAYSKQTPQKQPCLLPSYEDSAKQEAVLKIIDFLAEESGNPSPSIFCSSIKEFRIFPVQVCFQKEATTSTFDCLKEAEKYLSTRLEDTESDVEIEIDIDSWKKTAKAISSLFIFLEKLMVEKEPQILSQTDIDLKNSAIEAEEEESELLEDVSALLNKFRNPNELTSEEVYAVAYHVSCLFKSIFNFSDQIATLAKETLNTFTPTSQINTKKKELEEWSRSIKNQILPENCVVMRKMILF